MNSNEETEPTDLVISLGQEKDQTDDSFSAQRIGIIVSLLIIFASTGLFLISTPIGFIGMYFGAAVFFSSQFAASRLASKPLVLQPETSAVGLLASLMLTIVAIVASF